jgi:DNA recombination protein RmuC
MDVTTVVLTLAALVTGVATGWLFARRGAELRLHTVAAEAVAWRTALESERAAAAQREELLMRHSDIAGMLRPLSDSLAQVGRQLTEVEKGRASSDTALREQVLAMNRTSEYLGSQAGRLVTALRAPQVRGRWGEMQLERIVEAAGLTEHVDYDTQVTRTGENGTVRPDLVVRLPGGKQVVVDAKVACSAYLDAMEATDENTRDVRLKAHARQLRTHIDALSAKAYWEHFAPTPEFVVCFVPADSFLDAALRHDPSLLEHAFTHNVVLATPSTLIALLRTIAFTWRQDSLAANAKQVQELGRDLYKRLATLGGHFERLGRSLGSAVGAYNEAVGSVEHMVLAKARQLNDLGVVGPEAELRELGPLTTVLPRPVSAPEFLAEAQADVPRNVASISYHPAFPGSVPDDEPADRRDAASARDG